MQIDRATAAADMRMYGALRIHCDRFGTGAKIGTVRLPNFKENNEGFTKTEPTRSDEEILEAIKELAKKHAEKGTFHNADNEYLDLFKEYISSASPDRESILTSSLNQIFGKAKTNKEEGAIDFNKSILEQTLKIMEQAKNKNGATNNKTTFNIDLAGGAMCKVGWLDDDKLKDASFHDSNGELIANYSQHGWSILYTKAEQARKSEITAAYNEAFNSVYNAQNPSLSKSVDVGNTFDVVG
jgi:hypothetical protein